MCVHGSFLSREEEEEEEWERRVGKNVGATVGTTRVYTYTRLRVCTVC